MKKAKVKKSTKTIHIDWQKLWDDYGKWYDKTYTDFVWDQVKRSSRPIKAMAFIRKHVEKQLREILK